MTSKEYKKQKKISNRMKRKLALMFIVIVLALVGLSIRIVYINETNGDKYTKKVLQQQESNSCLLYTSPSPRDTERSRMPSSA